MSDISQSLTLFEPQNVQTIAQLAPQSFSDNSLSHMRCLEAGNNLLERVQKEGMNDALDIEISKYIEKAKVTLRKMNSRRSPVTQLFDRIRKAYTSMENDVDPSASASVPGRLQALRNGYAQKKHEEEERLRRMEAARIAKENAKAAYTAAVEEDYIRKFNSLVNKRLNLLAELDRQTTIDNYTATVDALRNFNCELPESWFTTVESDAIRPIELLPDNCRLIQTNVMARLVSRFKEQFVFEVLGTRDDILDRMPSKKKELERIAKASAEEAARLKAEMDAKEREEAARKEAERVEREKQEAAAAQLSSQKREMDSLFDMPTATPAAYAPKTQVKKKVVVESADDIMAIVAFWWSQEGRLKSVEELVKEFKKQINFANACANAKANPMFISNVRYEEEVKAK